MRIWRVKSFEMIKQIIELRSQGHSIRKIACALSLSRNTVRRYLRSEEAVVASAKTTSKKWSDSFDWEHAIKEVSAGATVQQVYKEMVPPVSYNRFCFHVRRRIKKPVKPAVRQSHPPGQKCFIDFCDGIAITDRATGRKTKTQFFMGVLPFSSYSYGEFTTDQKLGTFIRAHESMWIYFGGVTPYVVVDNLKAGVKKAHRYDPDVNPTYCDYGNHSGFAVLAARPYKPRDKASVEAGIGAVQRSFYQEVRHETFYSLDELNQRFRKFLEVFNTRIMKDHHVSRADRFEKEKPHLLELANPKYELAEWKIPKVHPDCCVQVDKSFYSVPYAYCGQNVRVKLTQKVVEIYSDGLEKIACHLRSTDHGRVIIEDTHLPTWKMQSSRYDLQKCRREAALIGPNTKALFEAWFTSERPLVYLRRAQGICRLKEKLDTKEIEYGCGQALTFKRYRLSYIKSCAESFRGWSTKKLESLPTRDPNTIHLHQKEIKR